MILQGLTESNYNESKIRMDVHGIRLDIEDVVFQAAMHIMLHHYCYPITDDKKTADSITVQLFD